jgi:hypothetical protein
MSLALLFWHTLVHAYYEFNSNYNVILEIFPRLKLTTEYLKALHANVLLQRLAILTLRMIVFFFSKPTKKMVLFNNDPFI